MHTTEGDSMTTTDQPVTLNPEAVGDPEQTPVVQLPPELAALFERTRCPECGLINQTHKPDCSRSDR